MPPNDTHTLYTEDEVLAKLERAMAQSSGALKTDIRTSIEARKKELRTG